TPATAVKTVRGATPYRAAATITPQAAAYTTGNHTHAPDATHPCSPAGRPNARTHPSTAGWRPSTTIRNPTVSVRGGRVPSSSCRRRQGSSEASPRARVGRREQVDSEALVLPPRRG